MNLLLSSECNLDWAAGYMVSGQWISLFSNCLVYPATEEQCEVGKTDVIHNFTYLAIRILVI